MNENCVDLFMAFFFGSRMNSTFVFCFKKMFVCNNYKHILQRTEKTIV